MSIAIKYHIAITVCVLTLNFAISQSRVNEVIDTILFYKISSTSGWTFEKDSIGDINMYHENKKVIGKLVIRRLRENRPYDNSELKNYAKSFYTNLGAKIGAKTVSRWSRVAFEIFGPDEKNAYSKLYYISNWNYGYIFIFRAIRYQDFGEADNLIYNFKTFVPWKNMLYGTGYFLFIIFTAFSIGMNINVLGKKKDVYNKYITALSKPSTINQSIIFKIQKKKSTSKLLRLLLIIILVTALGCFIWKYGFKSFSFIFTLCAWVFGHKCAPSNKIVYSKVRLALAGVGVAISWGLSNDRVSTDMLIDHMSDTTPDSISGDVDIGIDIDIF